MTSGLPSVPTERHFEALIEAVPTALLLVDGNGLMVFVNAQTEHLFGYTREELLGHPVETLLPLQFRSSHEGARRAFQRQPQARKMGAGRELYAVRKDGSEFPVEIGLNPIQGGSNALVMAAVIDISERKRSEDSWRESEERFRRLVSGVRDYAIIMLDREGRVASWNEGALHLKGYTEAEILGRHFSCFYPPDDVAAGKPGRELRQALEQGRLEDEDWRVRKDGSRFWANVIITPMHDAHGRLLGFSKVTRDLTERKRQEGRLRTVFESAPFAMIMVNECGAIELANRPAEVLFRYSPGELVGRLVDVLVPRRQFAAHSGLRRDYLATDARPRAMGTNRDLRGACKDGTEVPVEVGLNPIDTEEGRFVIAAITDISERKLAEKHLKDLNDSLARQIGETTTTLQRLREAQDQLVQSEKLASLGGLVAGVAHEINTPIGVGVTAASYLADSSAKLSAAIAAESLTRADLMRFAADAETSARILLTNLQRAADLVQSFKRVAVDQTNEEKRTISVKSYLHDVLLSLHPLLKKTPHKVEVECDADLQLDTTPGALSQILTNLVMNSLVHAFAPDHPGNIRIVVKGDGDGAQLIYSDDGCGMPPEHLSRVFEPFFTTRRGRGGTGLGLHIVFNLVHGVLGGTIHVSSTVGSGTRFDIHLPGSAPESLPPQRRPA